MKKRSRKVLKHARLEREWERIRTRLRNGPLSSFPDKTVELVDQCRRTSLRKLTPYISLGRLCLERDPKQEGLYSYEFPCLYFYSNQYVVAGYDNEQKWFFATAPEAVEFAQQHLYRMPLRPEHAQQIAASTMHSFTLNWVTASARIELHSEAGPLIAHLTGVSGCQAMRHELISNSPAVLSLEYVHGQLWLWLQSGDHLRVSATGFQLADG